MSDWAVGDLAVCVDNDPKPWNDAPQIADLTRLAVGQIYRVSGIGLIGPRSGPTIMLSDVPNIYSDKGFGWTALRFRKVLPDKHEACETEFVTLLQRIKRKQVA